MEEKISDTYHITEKKEQKPDEVWIIDDGQDAIGEIVRMWRIKISPDAYNFRHFGRASEALSEIEKRKEQHEKIPSLIFMDGNLLDDDGDLQQGSNVIKRIRDIDGIEQPFIVAHSSVEPSNKDMIEAGADIAFRKAEVDKTREFLLERLNKNKKEMTASQ